MSIVLWAIIYVAVGIVVGTVSVIVAISEMPASGRIAVGEVGLSVMFWPLFLLGWICIFIGIAVRKTK